MGEGTVVNIDVVLLCIEAAATTDFRIRIISPGQVPGKQAIRKGTQAAIYKNAASIACCIFVGSICLVIGDYAIFHNQF